MGNIIVLLPWLSSWLEGYGVCSYLEGMCAIPWIRSPGTFVVLVLSSFTTGVLVHSYLRDCGIYTRPLI